MKSELFRSLTRYLGSFPTFLFLKPLEVFYDKFLTFPLSYRRANLNRKCVLTYGFFSSFGLIFICVPAGYSILPHEDFELPL